MINRELIPEAASDELLRLRSELRAAEEAIARLERRNDELETMLMPPQHWVLQSFESTLRSFAKSLLSSTEKAFFSLLSQAIAKALGVDYVLIAEIAEGDHAKTLAYYAHGQSTDNFSYPLHGSPCAKALSQQSCFVSHNLQSAFPEDGALVDMRVDAYGGIALCDEAGSPVGLIAVLHREPFAFPEAVESLLKLVAKPAEAELRRLRAESETARRARALEQAYAELQHHSQRIEAEIAQRNRELTSEKALIDHIIASMPVGILYLDRSLAVRWTNAEHIRITGMGPERLVNRSFFEVFPNVAPDVALFDRVLEHGESVRITGYPMSVGDGTFYIDCTLVPIFEEDRSVKGILLFAVEVSARVENERLQQEQIETLRELDRLKGDFINSASHELRTPLTSITGYAEFLEDQVGGPLTADQRGFVTQIQEGAKRLQRIVDDMLDFARLEAGSFKLVVREADLGLLVQEELAFVQPQAKDARVTLRTDLPSESLRVPMDPSRIGQVLLNLLGNAIKFTPAGGEVTIAVRNERDKVRVEVRDTGIGISEEHVKRLFQKFFQVDPSMTRERGGAGLGLSIAKALVEAHGGSIGVTSRIGHGSVFWFTLPQVGEVEESAIVLD
jgi:PAS domain S-box-containing protein